MFTVVTYYKLSVKFTNLCHELINTLHINSCIINKLYLKYSLRKVSRSVCGGSLCYTVSCNSCHYSNNH